MPTIHFVMKNQAGEPITRDVHCPTGKTVMQAAVDAGLEGIAADCGGLLTCATCHVYVPAPWADRVTPATADEEGMLEFTASERKENSRLSCQITLTDDLDGLVIELPATQY